MNFPFGYVSFTGISQYLQLGHWDHVEKWDWRDGQVSDRSRKKVSRDRPTPEPTLQMWSGGGFCTHWSPKSVVYDGTFTKLHSFWGDGEPCITSKGMKRLRTFDSFVFLLFSFFENFENPWKTKSKRTSDVMMLSALNNRSLILGLEKVGRSTQKLAKLLVSNTWPMKFCLVRCKKGGCFFFKWFEQTEKSNSRDEERWGVGYFCKRFLSLEKHHEIGHNVQNT